MSDHVHNHHEHIYYKPPVNAPPLPPGAGILINKIFKLILS